MKTSKQFQEWVKEYWFPLCSMAPFVYFCFFDHPLQFYTGWIYYAFFGIASSLFLHFLTNRILKVERETLNFLKPSMIFFCISTIPTLNILTLEEPRVITFKVSDRGIVYSRTSEGYYFKFSIEDKNLKLPFLFSERGFAHVSQYQFDYWQKGETEIKVNVATGILAVPVVVQNKAVSFKGFELDQKTKKLLKFKVRNEPITDYNETRTTRYGNGQLRSKSAYKNGQLHGPATLYHINGREMVQVQHVDGHLHGSFRFKNGAGVLEKKLTFKMGKKHGPQYFYNAYGLSQVDVYEEDHLINTFSKEQLQNSDENNF